jgi:two-component system chemotaxis response regulator CheB
LGLVGEGSRSEQGETKLPNRDIIVIGASAGGVEALSNLVRGFPRDLPAAVFVVLHLNAQQRSYLPEILSRNGPLPAAHPQDGEKLKAGRIYVAPPDYHLMIHEKSVRLSRGPTENRHRPAVDPLFRSAAYYGGPRVVGAILTGALDDGTAGLHMVKKCGGIAIVQDPLEAFAPGMPQSAQQHVKIDHCLPLAKIPEVLVNYARESVLQAAAGPCDHFDKMLINGELMGHESMQKQFGPPSSIICPHCDGPIWEITDGKVTVFRCAEGHAYGPESLLAAAGENLERSLWVAVKTLDERAALLRRLIEKTSRGGRNLVTSSLQSRAEECEESSKSIRKILAALNSQIALGETEKTSNRK